MGKNILTKELLLKSVEEWNAAREANQNIYPDLSGEQLWMTDISGANLSGANLRGADLFMTNLSDTNLMFADLKEVILGGADLSRAKLVGADFCGLDLRFVKLKGNDFRGAALNSTNLCGADLRGAKLSLASLGRANLNRSNLSEADLSQADLSGADISESNLSGANLNSANFSGANLSHSDLSGANISESNLSGTNLSEAILRYTIFGAVDLSSALGLDTLIHFAPSTIGIDTLFASHGNIPEIFLRGCGVPDIFIEYARSLTAKPFDYYSCFISHSTSDNVFADRLYADLQAKGVPCWYAPHDMEGGEHVDTQIDRAIKVHEKLLLILSESSINSNWVKREIAKAVKREEAEGKRVLFPISLVDFSKIEAWEFVDSKGRDLSEEIRKFYIPSFKGWENDNSLYTTEFEKLMKAFKDKSKQ